MASVKGCCFIGAGAMGGSIARGLVEHGAISASELFVADPSEDVRAGFSALGAHAFKDAADMLAKSDAELVFIAVKPQLLAAVVRPLATALAGRLVVSIAAGVSLETLYGIVGHARIVRCMPNLPMQAAKGAVAITAGEAASPDDARLVQELLGMLGTAKIMREDQLDVAGVVSGASPAFFALFVDCLTRAAIRAGMTASDAREMVEATMAGTAEQLMREGIHPRAYMERVTSPGGTTIAALRAMEPALIEAAEEGLDAALARTRELAGS